MTRTPNMSRAIRHLELLEEGWKQAHDEATAFHEFEQALAESVAVFRIIQAWTAAVKRFAFQGAEEFESDWSESRRAHERWLTVAASRYAQVDRFEREFGRVRNGQELKECILSARDALVNWKPVPVPKALGSREIPISEDDAADLHALRNAPPGSPGKLNWTPQPIPTADASFFE